MNLKNISENTLNKRAISELIIGLGLDYIVDNSFIVLATFSLNGEKKRYYASGEDVKSVYNKALKYFDCSEFEGYIYHVQHGLGIPILHNQKLNIKCWN